MCVLSVRCMFGGVFTCSFLVKLAFKVLKVLRFILTLKTYGYNFLRAAQKGPQEGPKGCRDTAD